VKPICVPCQRFFRVTKNDFYFLEGMPVGEGRAAPGTTEPERWQPYRLWAADRWECEGCGAVILTGFGQSYIAEHYQPDFSEYVKTLGADQFQVNDC
jgi:hypothetical protein